MASQKVEICLKKKNPPEHKYSVTFVSKVGTTRLLVSGPWTWLMCFIFYGVTWNKIIDEV